MEHSLVDRGVEQQHDETRPMPVQSFHGSFVYGHATSSGKPTNLDASIEVVVIKYLSVGFGPGIYSTIDVEGWGCFWQYLGEDQSTRDTIPPRHIVPKGVPQP